jgi:hypothetical protein
MGQVLPVSFKTITEQVTDYIRRGFAGEPFPVSQWRMHH